MGQIPTQTATRIVEGMKIARSVAKTPVMITRIRTVGKDQQTIELQLEQLFEPPVNNQGGVLAFTMQGHTAFNSGPRKKVSWQNFSVQMAIKQGIIRSQEEVANSVIKTETGDMPGAMLVNKPLILRKDNGEEMPCKIVEVDTYTPREWADRSSGNMMKQRPKQAGPNGDVLTRGGKPIYRNTGLALPGSGDEITGREWDEDLVIIHDNAVVGSTVRAAMGKAGIAVPQMPGVAQGTRAIDQNTNTSSSEDLNLQNKDIGDTSDLVHGAPEGNRQTPDEQQEGAAEVTDAELNRESGVLPVRQ